MADGSGGVPVGQVEGLTEGAIPAVAASRGRTEVYRTGGWRNLTPRYVKRLPPCRAGCPVGNDILEWLEAAGGGRVDEATRLLAEEQPLPAVCGRVCYRPCEAACNRGKYDEALAVRAVERYLGDRLQRLEVMPRRLPAKGGRVRVVGSGPAGLAAAWLLARLGHSVEVVERAPYPGGLLRYGIPAYRLPRAVLDGELARLEQVGVRFTCGVEWSRGAGLGFLRGGCDALFLAPGASGRRSSGIDRAPRGAVVAALDFLARFRDGVAPEEVSATRRSLSLPIYSRDAGSGFDEEWLAKPSPRRVLEGKRVVVVGGGNSAVDAARVALRLGAEVSILYRRTRVEMPAYPEEVEAALEEGVKLQYLVSPEMFRVRGGWRLRCIRNVLGRPDAGGRRRPEPIPGSEFEVPVDLVIDAVGEMPDPGDITAEPEEQKALGVVDGWGATGVEGVWAGGDFAGGARTVADAIAWGKRAAADIDRHLSGGRREGLGRFRVGQTGFCAGEYIRFRAGEDVGPGYDGETPAGYDEINQAYFIPMQRARQAQASLSVRKAGFAEAATGLTRGQVVREAARCFHCGWCNLCGNCRVFCPDGAVRVEAGTGRLWFDLDHCKGCGVCDAECPRAAIEMFR